MNKAILLGSLFLRASSVYGGATHGDLIAEGRRRNEEAYERKLKHAGAREQKSSQAEKPKTSKAKSS